MTAQKLIFVSKIKPDDCTTPIDLLLVHSQFIRDHSLFLLLRNKRNGRCG